MKRNNKKRSSRTTTWLLVALCFTALVFLLMMIFMMQIVGKKDDVEPDVTVSPTESIADVSETTLEPSEEDPTDDMTDETTEATEPRQMLEELAEMYAENPDLAGWITIDDTKIDYPVMFTPEDGEKYIRADFKGKFSVGGLPFIEDGCSLDPESDNLIIYGHNMKNGTMFNNIMKYQQKSFWEEHKIIKFNTLYEERTYEVVAAFYDQIYKKTDTNFKFYQFVDAETEEDFNEAITYYKAHDLYETGVTAEFGDDLITLVTCAYHVDNGRFVVVARRVTDAN